MAAKKPRKGAPQKPSPVERDEKGRPVQGGGSLNPGGQPKWVKEVRDALAQNCVPLAEKRLRKILEEDHADPDDWIKAAKVVFEFTIPKPKQDVNVTGIPPSPFAGMTPEQLLAIARGGK